MRDLYLTHARRRAVFGAQNYGLPSRFLSRSRPTSSIARAAIAGDRRLRRRRAAAARATSWAASAQRHARGWAGAGFRMGDDVQHAAFGEGVVTGVEPGGIVVIRFAKDGSERKLMAEYAPITKR